LWVVGGILKGGKERVNDIRILIRGGRLENTNRAFPKIDGFSRRINYTPTALTKGRYSIEG